MNLMRLAPKWEPITEKRIIRKLAWSRQMILREITKKQAMKLVVGRESQIGFYRMLSVVYNASHRCILPRPCIIRRQAEYGCGLGDAIGIPRTVHQEHRTDNGCRRRPSGRRQGHHGHRFPGFIVEVISTYPPVS